MTNVLLTGFGAWAGSANNPAAAVARALDGETMFQLGVDTGDWGGLSRLRSVEQKNRRGTVGERRREGSETGQGCEGGLRKAEKVGTL